MKIELKNIKQHKSLCMVIPEKGITEIRGKSGAGKSSVLTAITDALLSNQDDLTNWDENKSSIEFDFLGMKIVKKRGPYSLTVTTEDGSVYIDEEAQGIIKSKLGMSEEEFEASSYVEQEARNSLLTLSPSDQMRFIQRLAFGENDPEAFKAKIKTKIDKYLVTMRLQEREFELALSENNSAYTAYKTALDDIEVIIPQPDYEKKNSLLIEMAENKKKLNVLSEELSTIKVKLSNPLYGQVELIEAEITKLLSVIDSNNEKNKQYHAQILGIREPTRQEIDHWNNTIIELKKVRPYQEWVKKAKEVKSQILELFPEFAQSKSLLEDLKSLGAKLNSKKLDEINEHVRCNNDLKSIDNIQPCPDCKAGLVVVNGRLSKHSHDLSQRSELTQSLALARDNLNKTIKEIEKVESSINQLNELKTSQPSRSAIDNDDPESSIEEAKANLVQINQRDTQLGFLKMTIETSSVDNHLNQVKIEKLKDKIKQAGSLEPKELLIEKQNQLMVGISEIQKSIQMLSEQVSVIDKSIQDWLVYERKLAAVEVTKNAFKKAALTKESCTSNLDNTKKKYASFLTLKEISDRAALEAVEDIINSINTNAKFYIDQMFPNDGTIAALQNKKILSSGDEKAKLSIRLYHKGSEVKKWKSLSGGEKARLTLAFQLAMSDLYQSPILMLDEAFNGLDLETKGICLEILRNTGTKKAVIVVEHGAPESFFDNIVDL